MSTGSALALFCSVKQHRLSEGRMTNQAGLSVT